MQHTVPRSSTKEEFCCLANANHRTRMASLPLQRTKDSSTKTINTLVQ